MEASGLISVGVVVAVVVGLILLTIFLYYVPIGLWIRTIAAGVPLNVFALFRMRLIGIQPSVIVTNLVRARKAGLMLTVDQMQSHYLAGGNVEKVTLALIAAQRAQIPLEWEHAAAIDLAGRDVLDAVQTSIIPKVIETPFFQGVAQNGIQLNVKARITVRTNLDQYVGGAGEPTIVARIGEGVVSAVGAAIDHKEVLEFPDRISKNVLAKGLDAGTAFQIVSIDIADVDVGKNIGAELQMSQAEADRRIAQAKASERQYAAQAAEQEQKAETQRMRAKVVEAEAQIPQAIAEAFRSGNLGVMDYYRLNNIKADTEMRGAIGQGVTPPEAAPSSQLQPPPVGGL
ncbi:MAG TPA: flotillin-like protein FloA [Candidatus Baltobacteraceae bacterium]